MNASLRRGVLIVLLGLCCAITGRFFDGALGGFFQGAAVALLLIGAFALSRARRDRGWLPSRDGEER